MQATLLHTIKTSQVTPDDDPYRLLIQAVVCRAVADAMGATSPARHVAPDVIREEARTWLVEEDGLVVLLELGGFDAAPIVHAIRRCLAEEVAYAGYIASGDPRPDPDQRGLVHAGHAGRVSRRPQAAPG